MVTRNEALQAAFDNALDSPGSASVFLAIAEHIAENGEAVKPSNTFVFNGVRDPQATAKAVHDATGAGYVAG